MWPWYVTVITNIAFIVKNIVLKKPRKDKNQLSNHINNDGVNKSKLN